MTEADSRKGSVLKKLGNLQRRAVVDNSAAAVIICDLPGGGRLPGLVQTSKRALGASAWIGDNRSLVERELASRGALLLRGFRMEGVDGFAEVARTCANDTVMDYTERSSPRKHVGSRIYTSTEYPASYPIFFHNENAYARYWPRRLCFTCVVAASSGGATPVADTRRVLDRIDPEIRERFARLNVRYVRNFGGPLGLHWKEVFQVETRDELEEKCRQSGYEFEWTGDDRLRTSRVGRAVLKHPDTGDLSWFNHAAFFHRTTLVETLGEAIAVVSDDELPSNSFYGDGTPIEADVAAAIREAYRNEAVRFDWRPGDILLVDNLVTAHARDAFSGHREVRVAMLDPMNAGPISSAAPPSGLAEPG